MRLSTIARHEAGVVLPADLLVPAGQPAVQERLFLQREVVRRQTQRVSHGGEAALGELHHHVDLQNLPLVVERQGFEVRVGEAAPLPLLQADGHGGAEHGETLVEANDLLLVQPQKRTVYQLVGVPDLALQDQVGLDRL